MRKLQAKLLNEGHRLYQSKTLYPTAVDRMIEFANPDALGHIDGNFRDLTSSTEGHPVIRLMVAADLKRRVSSGEHVAFMPDRGGVDNDRKTEMLREAVEEPDSPTRWPTGR